MLWPYQCYILNLKGYKMIPRIVALASTLIALPAIAANPQGFGAQTSPSDQQEVITTINHVVQNSLDDDIVTLRGKLTENIRDDDYVFMDEAGQKIQVELDSDKDWSMVKKDHAIEIRAKVDRNPNDVQLEVISVKPLQ